MNILVRHARALLLCLFGCAPSWAADALSDAATAERPAPDFAREVQPLFKEHCYECHGPQKQRNGYRLDRRSRAFMGQVRHNIIPGSSTSSRLYRRVLSSEFGAQMPPEE